MFLPFSHFNCKLHLPIVESVHNLIIIIQTINVISKFRWLRDNLDLIQDVKEVIELTESVEDCGDVYFVPAFSGLYAPYWKKEARG